MCLPKVLAPDEGKSITKKNKVWGAARLSQTSGGGELNRNRR